jgi:GNAT superfamily N-acetyltransferase
MKLIFEHWRVHLDAHSPSVEVKFPDNIPIEFLEKGEIESEISGFVYPEEERQRAGIYLNDELVGFMTPRKELDKGWRLGAIYINPDDRNKGVGSKAINKFFEERDASSVPIGIDNIASQKAFANAGFALLSPDEILTDENDGWKYQIWGRQVGLDY